MGAQLAPTWLEPWYFSYFISQPNLNRYGVMLNPITWLIECSYFLSALCKTHTCILAPKGFSFVISYSYIWYRAEKYGKINYIVIILINIRTFVGVCTKPNLFLHFEEKNDFKTFNPDQEITARPYCNCKYFNELFSPTLVHIILSVIPLLLMINNNNGKLHYRRFYTLKQSR